MSQAESVNGQRILNVAISPLFSRIYLAIAFLFLISCILSMAGIISIKIHLIGSMIFISLSCLYIGPSLPIWRRSELEIEDSSKLAEVAAMKEDIKFLKLNNEDKLADELFILETRRILGNNPQMPCDYYVRQTVDEIRAEMQVKRENY